MQLFKIILKALFEVLAQLGHFGVEGLFKPVVLVLGLFVVCDYCCIDFIDSFEYLFTLFLDFVLKVFFEFFKPEVQLLDCFRQGIQVTLLVFKELFLPLQLLLELGDIHVRVLSLCPDGLNGFLLLLLVLFEPVVHLVDLLSKLVVQL